MRIRDFTLRTKVYGAFAIVLSLDVLTGLAAAISLSMADSNAAGIRDLWLPSIAVVDDLISGVENYRIIEGQTLLTLDEAEQLASEELLWNARDEVFRLRTAYDRLRPRGTPDEYRIAALLVSFDADWTTYQIRSKQMIGHVFGGARNLAMARDIYNDAAEGFHQACDRLKDVQSYSAGQADRATERSKTIETVTTRLIVFVAVGATIVSWLLGLFILRSVTQPMSELTGVMRRMADDDLNAGEGLAGNRRDEIGIMVGALHELRRRLLERRRLIEEEKESLIKLQRAERELMEAERLAALGRMVAGVSHEINTPLGSAYTVATTLVETQKDFAALLTDHRLRRSDLESFVDRVGRAGELMTMTLQKANDLIRTFKQVAVDQTSSSRRCFELGELVNQVVLTTSPLFKRRPYRLDLDIPEPIEMDSFPGPLGQVLSNLLSNAVIHGLDGKADGTVVIRVRQVAPEVVDIIVSDDGKGILPEHMAHLFEPFFTTRFGQGGSGLGLNIAHGIVTNVLGGQIDVASRPGEGATFSLTLPLVAPAQAARQALAPPATIP